jgi:Zn-dependent protease with chaperone function
MSKFFQISLVLAYIFFSATVLGDLLLLFGIGISPAAKIELIGVWIFFCFTVHRLSAGFHLFRHLPVRNPILDEEQRIERLFAAVLQKSRFSGKIRFRIVERLEFDAFAIGRRTICLSRGIMEKLSDSAIQGIMAHELGHLISHDCIVGAAYNMALSLPFPYYYKLKYFLFKQKRKHPLGYYIFKQLRLIILIVLVLALILSGKGHQLMYFLFVIFSFRYYGKIQALFEFLYRTVIRFIEYKQDAYAQELGFGKELLEALTGLTCEEAAPVNLYENLMKYSHPVIYNRIRRLEKLEGLREPRKASNFALFRK